MSEKNISVVVPVYNEFSMLDEIYGRISAVMEKLENYTYEIVFFDDGSTDGTRKAIEELCEKHNEVKAVFYSRNFGYLKSTFYCMQQAKGDCAIIVHADLQNPPELIPEFIKKWENGAQVVQGVKNQSKENKFIYFLRTVFYFLMIKFFGLNITAHATEFELFDKSFIDVLGKIKTNTPFLRGIVSEYASNIEYVYYTQDARKKGKSKFNLNKYYDFAVCGITQYSRKIPRRLIAISFAAIVLALIECVFVFLPQLSEMSVMDISNSVIIRLLLIGLLGFMILSCLMFEYIITLIANSADKPLIIEEKRINY